MAGDLFIENLTYNQKTTLTEAGGVSVLSIFHSDKVYQKYNGGLSGKIASQDKSRVGLPPHAYVEFTQLNKDYQNDQMLRLKLNDVLSKMTRPAFLSQKASLNGWPGAGSQGAVQLLEAALRTGKIIVEFYTMDGAHLKDVFPQWTKVPE